MGHVLADDEHDRLPQQWIEPRQLARQPRLPVEIPSIGLMGDAREHQQTVLGARPRPAAAAVIAARIDRDAHQPGAEPGLSPERADLLDQGTADVLGNVLRICVRAGQPPGNPMNAIIVSPQQCVERAAIPGGSPLHQVAVGVFARRRTLAAQGRNDLRDRGSSPALPGSGDGLLLTARSSSRPSRPEALGQQSCLVASPPGSSIIFGRARAQAKGRA